MRLYSDRRETHTEFLKQQCKLDDLDCDRDEDEFAIGDSPMVSSLRGPNKTGQAPRSNWIYRACSEPVPVLLGALIVRRIERSCANYVNKQ